MILKPGGTIEGSVDFEREAPFGTQYTQVRVRALLACHGYVYLMRDSRQYL